MLKSYELELKPNKELGDVVGISYCLYAFLLKQFDHEYAEKVHDGYKTAINQCAYIENNIIYWKINALDKNAVYNMDSTIKKLKKISLKKNNIQFDVIEIKEKEIIDEFDLLNREVQERFTTIEFVTPVVLRNKKKEYYPFPDKELIIRNLIKKWNLQYPELQLEDEDGEGIDTLINGISIYKFDIHSELEKLGDITMVGAKGTIVIKNELNGVHKRIIDALIAISEYFGIGIKTKMGLGGVKIKEKR